MAGLEAFERDIKIATKGLKPDAINAALAKYAKEELARVIASGEASANYNRYVNNVPGAPGESVRVPGSILYVFSNWSLIIKDALAELQKRSPRVSGRFARSFIVIVNEKVVTDFAAIPVDAEVIITNFQPYVRRLESGRKVNGRKRRIIDSARSVLASRYRDGFRFQTMYLDITVGVHADIPYILKGEYARLRRARIANPAAFAGRSFPKRKDMEPGQPITYPSIVINVL